MQRLANFSPRFIWQRLLQLLDHYEKALLALLAVVIVVSGQYWFRQFTVSNQPAVGGTLVVGVLGGQDEMGQAALRLTKAGLFRIDNNGELQNQLISDWSKDETATEFRFHLLAGVSPDTIIREINNNASLLGAPTVALEEGELVVRNLESSPSLPILLAQPIFSYGPYKIQKTTGKMTVLSRQPQDWAKPSYINKIILQSFVDEDTLAQAFAKGKVDVFSNGIEPSLPNGATSQSLKFPQYNAVIFNINKTPFRDQTTRLGLINDQQVKAISFSLTFPDSEPQKNLAQQLKEKWEKLGASVELRPASPEDIRTKIATTRDFQALLSGVDYGTELDPYYIWHSSQIRPPGNNLSGIKSADVDGIINSIITSYNISNRYELIAQLHTQLEKEGAAQFLDQKSVQLYVARKVSVSNIWGIKETIDFIARVRDWSIK